MDVKIVKEDKDGLELEFSDKTVPNMLASELNKAGVDAYVYDEHPLFPGYRLHVEGKDAKAKLKKAVTSTEKDWADFKKQVIKGLK